MKPSQYFHTKQELIEMIINSQPTILQGVCDNELRQEFRTLPPYDFTIKFQNTVAIKAEYVGGDLYQLHYDNFTLKN